jgi:hypothetical protein
MTLERALHLDANMALVTGSAARVTDVTLAMEKEGFSTYSAPSDAVHLLEEIRYAVLPARSLNCYVQLPTTELDHGLAGSLAGLRALVANALLARFDALAVVAPLLAPGARVLIVPGDRAGVTGDTEVGLPAISVALAEAVLARRGPENVQTTVVGDNLTPGDIATAACRPRNGALAAVALAGYAAFSPELSYVEWRDEVLGLAAELSGGRLSDGWHWG